MTTELLVFPAAGEVLSLTAGAAGSTPTAGSVGSSNTPTPPTPTTDDYITTGYVVSDYVA